jgi:hypothetical protein
VCMCNETVVVNIVSTEVSGVVCMCNETVDVHIVLAKAMKIKQKDQTQT